MMNNADLFKMIDKSDIISFDIFDTLLLRPYAKPTDLFRHMERIKRAYPFADARINAEATARQKSKFEDITLDEIYDEIDEEYKDYKQFEIDMETQVLQQNPEMYEIYQYAIAKHKKVIIASDMYLDKSILENILKLKGYENYYKLYISSDIRKTKCNCSLYGYIVDDLKLEIADGQKMLHIGDNRHSDYDMALKSGILSYCYKKPLEQFIALPDNLKFKKLMAKHPDNLDLSIIVGMAVLNWIKNRENGYWQDFGYNFGGPLCYGFTKFCMDKALKKDISDIFFIARDGWTLNKIYDIIKGDCKIKAHYVYAPRVLKLNCLLDYSGREDELDSLFKNFASSSEEFNSKLLQENFNSFTDKIKFFNENKELLERLANVNRREYSNYLSSLDLAGENIYMVDSIAINFSAQTLLSKILKNKNLFAGYIRADVKNAKKYYFEFDSYLDDCDILKNWNLVEFIITSVEPPLKNIRNNKPVYKSEITEYEKTRSEIYSVVSEYEVKFSQNILKIFGNYRVEFDYTNISILLNCFYDNLNERDQQNFKLLYHAADSNHSSYLSLLDIADKPKGIKKFFMKLFRKRRRK